jgi:hypothetical protein
MKTIEEILDSTPKKDTLTLKVGNKSFTVTEENIRWLQVNIARGDFDPKDVVLISPNGAETRFNTYGIALSPVEGANTMTLNDDLATLILFSRVNRSTEI